MGATYKNNIELTIFGESHGKAIGITIGSGSKVTGDSITKTAVTGGYECTYEKKSTRTK